MLSSRKLRNMERQAAVRAQSLESMRLKHENAEHEQYRTKINHQIQHMMRKLDLQQNTLARMQSKHLDAQAQCDELLKDTGNYSSRIAYTVADHDTRYLEAGGRVGNYRPFQVCAEISTMHDDGKIVKRRKPFTSYTSMMKKDTNDLKQQTRKLTDKGEQLRLKYHIF